MREEEERMETYYIYKSIAFEVEERSRMGGNLHEPEKVHSHFIYLILFFKCVIFENGS